jgi:hypothetical protein
MTVSREDMALALGELVRERQDLVEQASAVDRALIALMSQPTRSPTARDALRQRAEGIAPRLKEIDAALAARFPQYAALARVGPAPLRDAAALLRPDEALLLFAPANDATYSWSITREASRWVRIPLGREKLAELIAALRCGLDTEGAWSGAGARRCTELLRLTRPPGSAGPAPFDLDRADGLYRALLGPVEDLIDGKHLLIVPALLLTPPSQASEDDDGLLTASEVAQLKLDADWVILSACNTAAGDDLEAEALSGLARAFFYAGSRALLASHWYVDSEAAVALVTRAFAEINAQAGVGRAEALRRAMLALVGQGGRLAHPAIWAPFVVVGEGAR